MTTGTTAKEQSTLPYGTVITSETTANTNQKFTSYDRSDKTGLDYAVNRIYSSEQGRFTQPDPIGMASVDLTDPQTLNLYTYARNNPIDFTDPTGLMPVGPGYCIRYHYTNLSGTIQFWGPWTCYGGSGGGYDEPDSFGFANNENTPPEPKQDKKRCIVKNMGSMSEALQNMISGFGIENAEFDRLGNKAKLGFLNVLGAMADKELSLMGWNVDRKWRGSRLKIDQERTYFTPKNPKSSVYDNLKAAVSKSNFKQQNRFKHKNVDTSFRQNVSKNSMQIGFGYNKGKPFMEIDIDPNNPHKRPGAHAVDYFFRSPTDPYRVANRRYWECKPQKGGGKK